MSLTVDCGEGRHDVCSGTGRTAYLFPQNSRGLDEPPFNCACTCHNGETRTGHAPVNETAKRRRQRALAEGE